MFHDFDPLWWILLQISPVVAVLSVLMGVRGCGWFRASKIVRNEMSVCALWNTPAVSASAADATTWFNVLHSTKMAPLRGVH